VNPSSPLVSVIVPTRNSARTLDACLNSARSQSYPEVELVVVDNFSTDQTTTIARRYADLIETVGPERSVQRNFGASVSHGEYLLFIDSDMVLADGVIRDCVQAIQLSGFPGVIISEATIGTGFISRCRALERSCYVGDNTIEGARFFPRAEFEAVHGYDERIHALEDWDLSLRIADGRQFARISSQIVHDEGHVRLGELLTKKRYYARAALYYLHRHRGTGLAQANLIFRPAFFRNWRRLAAHPILTLGFLSIKTLEVAAGVLGLVDTWSTKEPVHSTKPLV